MKKKTFRERYGVQNTTSQVFKEIQEILKESSKPKKTTKKKAK